MSFCKDCVKGVTHDGTPQGKIEKIGGVECYIATPSIDYPKDKVVLFLTDAFGLPLPNNQLLADDFAANGFKTKEFDVMAWLKTHTTADTRPTLDKVIAALKSEGVTSFAAHPDSVPQKYKSTAKAPLLINSCTVDTQFPLEAQAKADEIFKDFAPGYKREYFEGCTHGFAVRGDLSDPKVKAGKEGAFKATVEWFIKYA
ncbi:chlorocatechol-degradation protein [Mycena amicta]|nr:chlorocatechol-degradation protein [Mycena amicta]